MVRFFEILAIVSLLGAGYGAYKNTWTTPGTIVRDVPKNVRSNPASYRSHYRFIIVRGGK
ncbi:MAG: hypothetical protein ACI9OJ_000939 [Myxococcota bacterium]|jgi:hypothetical protein